MTGLQEILSQSKYHPNKELLRFKFKIIEYLIKLAYNCGVYLQSHPSMRNSVLLSCLLFISVIIEAQTFVSTNMPLILIETSGRSIPEGYKIPATMKIIYNDSGVNTCQDSGNVYTGNIGIEIRGRYSATLPQKPYGIETRDASGNNLNVSLLGMPAENDWILIANYNDKSFVRNALAFRMFRDCGNYAPRTVLCEVFVNGSYLGIYVLTEKIKTDKGRVNIKKLGTNDNDGDAVTGGYIFSVDYYENSDSWMGSFSPPGYPDKDIYYVYNFPKPDEITLQQKAYIRNFVYDFESVLYGNDFKNPLTGYRAYINVPSFIDYFIISEVSRNVDGYKKSCFYNKNRNSVNGLLNAGPVWDFDWAWKNIPECYFGVTDGSGWAYKVLECNGWPTPTGWIPRLMEDPKFVEQLKVRYSTLRKTTLSNEYLMHYIDSVNIVVAEAQVRHFVKWPILGQNVGTPEVGNIPATFEGETTKFKNWITKRLSWLDSQLLVPLGTGPEKPTAGQISKLFPNPAHDILNIKVNLPVESVRIYNYTGKLIRIATDKVQGPLQLDISTLGTGIYIVEVKLLAGSTISNKLIIN